MKITYLLPLALMIVAGCSGSDGVERPPPTRLHVFNGAPSYDTLLFLREQKMEAQMSFGEGVTLSFDSGPYDFNIEYPKAGTSQTVRVLTLSEDLSPSRDYSFIQISPNHELQTLVFSTEAELSSDSVARISVIHAHPDLAGIDVYVVASGTDLTGLQPQGSVSFGNSPSVFEVTPSAYEFVFTRSGDPSAVLLRSAEFDVQAGADSVLVISDPGPVSSLGIAVTEISGGTAVRLGAVGVDSQLRGIQTVDDRLDRDLYVDDEIDPLFATRLAFGELSAYAPIDSDAQTLKLTPPGGGTVEASIPGFNPFAGRYYTALFSGDTTNGILGTVFAEDARPIVGQATLRLAHAAGLFGVLSVFILDPGTDVTTARPTVGMGSAPAVTDALAFPPGEYEVTVVNAETEAVLAGPELLTFEELGVYGLMFLNSADANTLDIKYLYDLAP